MQRYRFNIYEEIGCFTQLGDYGLSGTILTPILIFFPLASLTLYSRACPIPLPTCGSDLAQLHSFGRTTDVNEALAVQLGALQSPIVTCIPGCLHWA